MKKSFPDSQAVFPNGPTVDTDHNPDVTSHSNAAVVQEFIDLFEHYFFEGLSRVADPSHLEPSQIETLNMTAVNRAGDVLLRKYSFSEKEVAKLAEQAIKAMATSSSQKIPPAGDAPIKKKMPSRGTNENRR